MISEELIKESWPSAIEGDFHHSVLGVIHFWTGENKDRIVARFKYDGQAIGESENIFFINSKNGSWSLTQISTFQNTNSKIKLVKIQSFKEYEKLEKKYHTIIELFMKSRQSRKLF